MLPFNVVLCSRFLQLRLARRALLVRRLGLQLILPFNLVPLDLELGDPELSRSSARLEIGILILEIVDLNLKQFLLLLLCLRRDERHHGPSIGRRHVQAKIPPTGTVPAYIRYR